MDTKENIKVNGFEISLYTRDFKNDYISLTDIAKFKNKENPAEIIKNWLRNRNTVEFLGIWEQLHNPNFKLVEFDQFKKEAGLNSFILSPQKWINTTNAIGIQSKSGRYGGTFAHTDIAFEFASWVSAEFKLYIIKEYQRLKIDESNRLSLDWNLKRELSKVNYKLQTDAIKENIIPNVVVKNKGIIYASEADLINKVIFGLTAKEWKNQNPNSKGNIRDYATKKELLILSNLENYNSILIKENKSQEERFYLLRKELLSQQYILDEKRIERLK
jgi:hypothetical protein